MSLVPLFAAWAVAVVSPGPDFLAVLRTSAARGRREGTVVGAGVVCGIACWAVLAITGLSLLLARFAGLYVAMRLIGAIVLAAYGLRILWSAWRSRGQAGSGHEAVDGRPAMGALRAWRLGLVTNLANPKAVVFFGALFATVLPPHLGAAQRAGVLAVMLTMALVWFTLVALVAGSGPVMRGYRRAERVIDVAAGGTFTAVGVALAAH